jgi:hypothetical protein
MMSSPVMGDDGFFLLPCHPEKTESPRPPSRRGLHAVYGAGNRALLTVPLLCARWRRRFQTEGSHQVQRRITQTLLMQCRPQVDDVAEVRTYFAVQNFAEYNSRRKTSPRILASTR